MVGHCRCVDASGVSSMYHAWLEILSCGKGLIGSW